MVKQTMPPKTPGEFGTRPKTPTLWVTTNLPPELVNRLSPGSIPLVWEFNVEYLKMYLELSKRRLQPTHLRELLQHLQSSQVIRVSFYKPWLNRAALNIGVKNSLGGEDTYIIKLPINEEALEKYTKKDQLSVAITQKLLKKKDVFRYCTKIPLETQHKILEIARKLVPCLPEKEMNARNINIEVLCDFLSKALNHVSARIDLAGL